MTTPTQHAVPSWIRRGKLRWVWGLWEPLMLYRRSAHMAVYSPGNAHWTREWYERMHSEEIVAKLAELGINCLTTHYYKGFGVEAEAEEMERAVAFTELCHSYDIRVLGYHQWATICYETFLDEVPHAKDWVQRDANGKLLLYGTNTYWRWLGCQQHDEYFAYLSNVVQRCLTEANMDGIEWDGTVYKCHCELCQQRFREFLEREYADADVLELFGIPHFRNVRIPTTTSLIDPLYQALLEFRREFTAKRLREYNDLIKSINPKAAQVTYIFRAAPAEPEDGIDILLDENHDVPFVLDDELTSTMRCMKQGMAQDRVVLSTGWLRAPAPEPAHDAVHFESEAEVAAFGAAVGGLRCPETAEEVKLDLAEAAVYGGHIVTATWALRAVGGDKAVFEAPHIYAPLRNYMSFFRDHEELYDVKESLANVAVYRSYRSLSYDFFNSYPCIVGVEQTCLQHQIPFDLLFSHQLDQLDCYEAVVLAEQTCLNDMEIATFAEFANSGGGLVITGRTGLFDERLRHRDSHPLKALFDLPRVIFLPDNPERLSRPKRDHHPAYHDMRLPTRSAEIADAITTAVNDALPYTIEANRFVGTDAHLLASGAQVIHLLNYDNRNPIEDVVISLSPDLATNQARLISPDSEPMEYELEAEDGQFIIDHLETYAMLVLDKP